METPLIKIGDTVINMDNVACIKEDGGNLEIDFVSSRADHVQRIKLRGIEAARFSAYLTSVVHEPGIEGP
jgi:hypothetical protein